MAVLVAFYLRWVLKIMRHAKPMKLYINHGDVEQIGVVMYKLLYKLMKEDALVALYTNKNDYESFAVGYINQLIDDKAIILHVGVHGEFDGYSACYIDDIYKLETDSKYLEKMSKLKHWDKSDVPKINVKNDCFNSLIDTALENKSIIAIGCYDSDNAITGYVINHSDGLLKILQVNEYGEEDGEVIIYNKDINKIVINDVECSEIDELYHYES